jgi:hypothetical protein
MCWVGVTRDVFACSGRVSTWFIHMTLPPAPTRAFGLRLVFTAPIHSRCPDPCPTGEITISGFEISRFDLEPRDSKFRNFKIRDCDLPPGQVTVSRLRLGLTRPGTLGRLMQNPLLFE